MAKGDRVHVTMRCRECQAYAYHTKKNRRTTTERLELTKYCPRCRCRQAFRETVIDDFCRAYAAGRTPNPCIRCNDWVKFGLMLQRAQGLEPGAERMARSGSQISLIFVQPQTIL